MSKTRDARGKGPSSPKKGGGPAEVEPAAVVWPEPLKPQRALFIVLAIFLVALFAGMLALYFKTVYPNRNQPQPVERDQPPALSVPR